MICSFGGEKREDNRSVQQLAEDLRNGDLDASEHLIKKFFWEVFRYISYRFRNYRVDFEGETQEVFLKVWLKIDQLSDPSKFRSWLFTITHRHCIDVWRRLSKELRQTDIYRFDDLDNEGQGLGIQFQDPNSETPFRVIDDRVLLETALASLSQQHRLVVELHYFEDRSVVEVAQALGISRQHTHRLRNEALDLLRSALED